MFVRLLKYVVPAVVVFILSGCAGTIKKDFAWQASDSDLVWPAPPVQERIRYLRSITGADDFKADDQKSRAWTWLFGKTSTDIPLLTPHSVVVSPEGTVWVADSGSKTLHKISLAYEKVEYFQGFGDNGFVLPAGLAIDSASGLIYLSDPVLSEVYVFTSEGELVSKLTPPGGFIRPAGMAVDLSGNVYVADVLSGVVFVFDNQGNYSNKLSSKVAPDGRFQRPIDVAIGPEGEIVVLDAALFHLEVQSSSGNLLRTIGKVGDAPGSFARPKGVAVNSLGHIFVTDAAFDNIQVFDMAGQLLMYWGESGSDAGGFSLPAGIFVDAEGRIFVADSYNNRIQVFQGPRPSIHAEK